MLLSYVIIKFYPAFVLFVDVLKYYKIKSSCFYTSFAFKINENFDFFVELFEVISFYFSCGFFSFRCFFILVCADFVIGIQTAESTRH